MDAFSKLKTQDYAINSHRIREHLDSICKVDNDSTLTDYKVRSYYLNRNPFLWIDRQGIDSRVDTLLSYLDKVDDMGFTEQSFSVYKIRRDVQRVRNLNFDSLSNINTVLARLEYRLTKAYLRYVTGQRFGFVNPSYLFNRRDVLDKDSSGNVRYRKLFDINMQHPHKKFFSLAFAILSSDSLGDFLRQVQPVNPYYYQLKSKLHTEHITSAERTKILCNMERCRWRETQKMPKKGKYIVVNIPAYSLFAIDDEEEQALRIGCGALKTKTPLLSSNIYRLDVNPKWNVPMSIVKKDIARHAGNQSYFERHNMYVTYKKTGEKIDVSRVSAAMLLGGDYRVMQDGGEGNSLGRIIFRFPNNFAVYLHDTSTKEVFDRDDRGVSHGCIRVDKPYELAKFVIGNSDTLLEEIRTEMGLDEYGAPLETSLDDETRKKVHMKTINIKQKIPLFITYYTLYKDVSGNIASYPDVYGYDRIISDALQPFMK